MRILIVDDSKAMRKIVSRALQASSAYCGAELVEAGDGREALDAISAQAPDIVLSDWNMPEMNGIELLQEINAQGVQVRFGFVTSESTPEMYEQAKANGAEFMVTKPFTPESLERALTTS